MRQLASDRGDAGLGAAYVAASRPWINQVVCCVGDDGQLIWKFAPE